MQEHIKADSLKRLNYIEGHLAGIRRMIEADQYCVDVLKQTRAVRRAIEKLESRILDGHLGSCVVEGIKDGREAQIINELSELYKIANR
jgi:DNA-binding FrmR family transcriptional regulator